MHKKRNMFTFLSIDDSDHYEILHRLINGCINFIVSFYLRIVKMLTGFLIETELFKV